MIKKMAFILLYTVHCGEMEGNQAIQVKQTEHGHFFNI